MTKLFRPGPKPGSLGRISALAVAAFALVALPEAALAQRGQPQAAQSQGQPQLRLSRPVQKLVAEAQKAQQSGDNQGSLAILQQAEALPNRNTDDEYIIAMLRLNAAIGLSDNALIERSLEQALATGRVSAEDEARFRRNLGAFALQRNDYQKAMREFERLVQLNPDDPQLVVEIAELQRRQNQNAQAVATLQRAISLQEQANPGSRADESWYRRALAIAYDARLQNEIVATSEALVRAYPNPTNWRDVLVIFRENARLDDHGNLDVLRLMRANRALAGERDYIEFAETAALRGLPGEAQAVLNEGLERQALQQTQPAYREISRSVAPRVTSDRQSLPGLEREAMAASNGRLALGVADAHLGYGNYQKAAEFYRAALSKGGQGVDPAAVNIRLALALGRMGDRAGAESALGAVQGAPRDQLARFYRIWLEQQGQAQGQPA